MQGIYPQTSTPVQVEEEDERKIYPETDFKITKISKELEEATELGYKTDTKTNRRVDYEFIQVEDIEALNFDELDRKLKELSAFVEGGKNSNITGMNKIHISSNKKSTSRLSNLEENEDYLQKETEEVP